jgi:hypothetical protein
MYQGSGVKGPASEEGKREASQYRTEGKFISGDQVIQLSKDKDGVVMRRRTVAKGGKLSGVLHKPTPGYTERPKHGYGYGNQHGYGGSRGYGSNQYDRYGGYGNSPS